MKFYQRQIDEVVQLDRNNSAGLCKHYSEILDNEKFRVERQAFNQRLDETYAAHGVDETLRLVDEKIAATQPGEYRNDLQRIRFMFLRKGERLDDAIVYGRKLVSDETIPLKDRRNHQSNLAAMLAKMGRIDESVVEYDQLIAGAQKDDPRFAFNMIEAKAQVFYHYAKRYPQVLETWDAALKLVKPNTQNWVRVQSGRAAILARLGRIEDAWSAYDQLAMSPACTPNNRLFALASMATEFHAHGSASAAREAASKTKKALDELQDSTLDPRDLNRLHEIIDQAMGDSADKAKD